MRRLWRPSDFHLRAAARRSLSLASDARSDAPRSRASSRRGGNVLVSSRYTDREKCSRVYNLSRDHATGDRVFLCHAVISGELEVRMRRSLGLIEGRTGAG